MTSPVDLRPIYEKRRKKTSVLYVFFFIMSRKKKGKTCGLLSENPAAARSPGGVDVNTRAVRTFTKRVGTIAEVRNVKVSLFLVIYYIFSVCGGRK